MSVEACNPGWRKEEPCAQDSSGGGESRLDFKAK